MKVTWQNKAKSRLRDLRMTQDDLAEKLEVSKGTISHWLSGRHQPSISRLIRIAFLLDIPFAELIANDDAICQNGWELNMLRILRAIPADKQGQADIFISTLAKTLGANLDQSHPTDAKSPPDP